MSAKTALLNGPEKDRLARDLEDFVAALVERKTDVLTGAQVSTYHEYASMFAERQLSVYVAAEVRRIIAKHLEG